MEVKENPSLPSNYVSIVHLRQRWLEEQEQKLKENEEQRRLEQKFQEDKKKMEEKRDQRFEVGDHAFQRGNRAVPASNLYEEKDLRHANAKGNEGEAPVADSGIERDEKKKKKKKKKMMKKKKSEEKNPNEENKEESTKKCKGEIRESECEIEVGRKNVWARKFDEKKGMESQCGPESCNVVSMKEMEQKLSYLSVSSDMKRDNNSQMGFHKGMNQGRRNFRDDRNLHRRRGHHPCDGGMVWVRKDEVSNKKIDGSGAVLNRENTVDLVSRKWGEKSAY